MIFTCRHGTAVSLTCEECHSEDEAREREYRLWRAAQGLANEPETQPAHPDPSALMDLLAPLPGPSRDPWPERIAAAHRWQDARADDKRTQDARRQADALDGVLPWWRWRPDPELLRAAGWCAAIVGFIGLVFWLHSS